MRRIESGGTAQDHGRMHGMYEPVIYERTEMNMLLPVSTRAETCSRVKLVQHSVPNKSIECNRDDNMYAVVCDAR